MIILCIIIVVILVFFLLYNNLKENYKLLGQIEDVDERNPVVSVTGSIVGISVKYGPGSDYSKYHQKKARGQIRTTGEDS